jgi:hypothetical protein
MGQVLLNQGAVDLERVTQDGSKVRAETTWACLSCKVSIWIRLHLKRALQQPPT